MKKIFSIKFVVISLCMLIIFSTTIFATDDYQSYENMMRQSYLQDNTISLKERVYSEYNIPAHVFEDLSERVILSVYDSNFNLDDTTELYEAMGYHKTASFIKELSNNTLNTIPKIKSNECFIHNDRYETRTVLLYPNGDKTTVNIAYNKVLPYLYFADNVQFNAIGISFDIRNSDINILDDYCISKGEKISQYADMDEFMGNFMLASFVILILIIIVTYLNKKTVKTNSIIKINDETKLNDNELIAILTAAIATYEQTNTNGIKIKTIRKNIRWKNI